MPYIPTLDFAKKKGALTVSYRGSAERQRLTVDIEHRKSVDVVECGYLQMFGIKHAVNSGYCGGELFPPSSGYFEILSEPPAPAKSFHWDLEVSGLAPGWMRTFVERQMSGDSPVKHMAIHGSLPLDSSPHSVTERDVIAWLDDTTSFPGAWPHVPFEVEVSSLPKGAFLRVDFASQLVTPELLQEFTDWLANWGGIGAWLPDAAQEEPTLFTSKDSAARTKSAITVQWNDLDVSFEPARDSLINGMIRFHEQVAAIRKLKLEL